MVLGFIIAKLNVVKTEDSIVFSKISLYLLMPSAILNAFDFRLSDSVVSGIAVAFLAAIIIHVVLYLFDLIYGKFISKNPVERASVMYSNAGNLIIPIVSFVLGSEWVVFSTAFLAVQLFFLWSHGVRLFSSHEKFNVKKVLLNVNMIAIALGMILMIFGIPLPGFVSEITSSFSSMLGPVGMLIAGMLAANIDFKRIFTDIKIYRVITIRMVIYPLVMLGVLMLFSLIPIPSIEKILLISFLASITPSATSVLQFAQIHGKDAEYATAINIFTTVLCVITMPLFVALFEFVI
jgi:predicted permease